MVSNAILSAYAWAQAMLMSFKEEHGQDILEYAVISGAIAIVAAIVLIADPGIFDSLTDFSTEVQDCIVFSDDCGSF